MSRRVFYVSAVQVETTDLDIRAIVSSSIVWNRRHDLTGMLVASPHYFAQVLEGRAQDIDSVLERIRRDSHHHSVRLQIDEVIGLRTFQRWAMALVIRNDLRDTLGQLHSRDRPMTDKLATLETFARASLDFAPEL